MIVTVNIFSKKEKWRTLVWGGKYKIRFETEVPGNSQNLGVKLVVNPLKFLI